MSQVSQLWSQTASAGEVESGARDGLAQEMQEWLEAGNDGVLLTTCHRVELYGFGDAPTLHAARFRTGPGAASHLMRVAAGLESAIVGEDEVLHQVRDALRSAELNRHLDSRLRR